MNTLTFTLTGDVNIQVVVTELDDGSLKFDLSVLDDTGSIGDLNAIYFDLADDSLTDGLSATGSDVTGENFDADRVTKVDNYTNINGEVVKDYGKFDAGVQFGTAGIGTDDIRETSFILSHNPDNPEEAVDLTIEMVLGQDFGARLTSVGEEGGERDDSLKLGGTSPEDPDEPDPMYFANDDVLRVTESETFDARGGTDTLEGRALSVLENDDLDGPWQENQVVSVNGDTAFEGTIIAGSDGGFLKMYPDGTVDFSAGDDFISLNEGEVTTTTFEYGIEGGDTATLTVYVAGEGDVMG